MNQRVDTPLIGMNALVTGGAAGIGQAIALRLAEAGAHVIVADVHQTEETMRLLTAAGAGADSVLCDVANEVSVRGMGQRVRELADGRIDILINCAGVNGDAQLVKDMPLERWEHTLRVNLTGTMLVSREIIPTMIANSSGRIVTVASNVARRGLAYRADYVASKWAVLGLTQTLALELTSHGIRVNAVCPGPVQAARIEQIMLSHAKAEQKPIEQIRQEWEDAAPMKRFITREEVADVVVFLAGDQSSAMTGQALNVTGGALMT